MSAVLVRPMVRRNDTAVKIDTEVVAEAKMVAASRGLSLAEYLSEILRPIVHRDLQEETTKRLGEPHKARRPKLGE